MRTGNKQTDASDSHQGQSVKPLPNFQVSLRENTRGRVKPASREGGRGGVWGGEFGIGWRMWLDYWLTTLLVHHSDLDEKPAGGWILNLDYRRDSIWIYCLTAGRLTVTEASSLTELTEACSLGTSKVLVFCCCGEKPAPCYNLQANLLAKLRTNILKYKANLHVQREVSQGSKLTAI